MTLELGEVSGVISSYLTDCWDWACAKNDLMCGAELVVEEVPAVTYCEACDSTYGTVEHGRICQMCIRDSHWGAMAIYTTRCGVTSAG